MEKVLRRTDTVMLIANLTLTLRGVNLKAINKRMNEVYAKRNVICLKVNLTEIVFIIIATYRSLK